jgi:hypothetical protein
MADGMVPVAAMGNPIKSPDTFGQLSTILGLQQQRQALQTQALLQQQEQIKTQAAQDTNDFFKNFDPTQWVAPNGTTDVNGVMSKDPNYRSLSGAGKAAVTEKLQAIQGKQTENMTAMASADRETVRNFSQMMAVHAARPEVQADTPEGRTLMQTAVKDYALQGPEQAKIAGIYGKAFQNPELGGAKPGHLGAAVAAIAAQAQTVSEQQAQSNPDDIVNANQQHINRNRATGALSAAPGSSDAINPRGSVVAGQTKATTGLADIDTERAGQISASVAPSRSIISLTQQLDDYVDQTRTGKFSKAVTDYMAAAGLKDPAIAARQLASKTAAQIRAQASVNAPSNEARETIAAGSPDPDTMGPEAVHAANELVRGNMRLNLARSANAARFQQKHGGTQGLHLADDQLARSADGLMYEYQSLPKGPARTEFIKRHFQSPGEAAEFIHRKNLVDHNGGFAD